MGIKRYKALMPENTYRFGKNQETSDLIILLWRLGSVCIDHVKPLLLGTESKDGYMFDPHLQRDVSEETRDYLVDSMIDLLIELDITPEDVMQSWRRVEQIREEDIAWGAGEY